MPIELKPKGKTPKIVSEGGTDAMGGGMNDVGEDRNDVIEEKKIEIKTEPVLKSGDIRKLRALPEKPGDNVSYEISLRWIEPLTNDQLDRIMIYTYRSSPREIRQTGEGYIDCIQGIDWRTEFNLENIKSLKIMFLRGCAHIF